MPYPYGRIGVTRRTDQPEGRDTRRVNTLARPSPALKFGHADPSLTPYAGLALICETSRILDVVATIDRHVGTIKAPRRGVEAGELLVSMAESMLCGGDFFADLDTLRADAAGAAVRTVAQTPAARTALGLANRFGDSHVEGLRAAQAELVARYVATMGRPRRRALLAIRPTIDIDPTDAQVYGTQKERIAWNYAGKRAGRPVPLTWAEGGLVLTGKLLAGDNDPRPHAPALIREAIAALPQGCARPRVRADSGLFSGDVARSALNAGADFAIAAARNPAVRAAMRDIPESAWQPAKVMRDAEVAACDYAPAGWPGGTRLIVRRVRIRAGEISTDPRSRRRRTFDPAQLELALGGTAAHAYAYSPIVTNLTGSARDIESWFREHAQIEERIKDTKLGMALRHLPSGVAAANEVWMWAACLALTFSVALQGLTNHDCPHRAHGKRLRRELITIPARVARHARHLVIRLAPEHHDGAFPAAYQMLRALPDPAD